MCVEGKLDGSTVAEHSLESGKSGHHIYTSIVLSPAMEEKPTLEQEATEGTIHA